MKKLDLYIGGTRVDLFSDEQITITIQQQNVKDISKVFSDFTQTFTLPASKTNNRVFKHYYRTDLLTGFFDASKKVEAAIQIGGVLFRNGVIELEQVTMKDGEAAHYAVTFYGNTTQLIDLFGPDKLEDLDLSAYRHKFNVGVIRDSITLNNLKSGNVMYPLISNVRNWNIGGHNTSDATLEANDILYKSQHAGHGIYFNELKPAIKVKRLIEAIGTKYGISFSGSWMSAADTEKLFLYCSNKAGSWLEDNPNDLGEKVNFVSIGSGGGTWGVDLTNDQLFPDGTRAAMEGTATLPAGKPYKITITKDGEIFKTQTAVGTGSPQTIDFGPYDFDDNAVLEFYLKTTNGDSTTFKFDFKAVDFYDWNIQLVNVIGETGQLYEVWIDIEGTIPDMTITAFLTSLIKMHNLTITPVSKTLFRLDQLDDWYNLGGELYADKTISTKSVQIIRPSMYKKISFKYQQAGTILAKQYFESYGIGYADAEATFDVDGEDFEISVDFEPIMMERLTNVNDGTLSNICVGKMLDKELKAYVGKPLILYHSGSVTMTSGNALGFGTSTTTSEILTYQLFGQTTSKDGVGTYSSLNFGAPIDPFFLQAATSSLYSNNWQNYISGLYNPRKRQVKCNGVVTFHQAINLEPNTKLKWRNDLYLINSATLNLMTGEVSFDLTNSL